MEFETIGQRCEIPFCNQHDYLPFKCKHCTKSHCKLHANDHNCSSQNKTDRKCFQCPTCLKSLYHTADISPDLIVTSLQKTKIKYEQHLTNECKGKEEFDQRKVQKAINRCSLLYCSTKLTNVQKYTCNSCGMEFC